MNRSSGLRMVIIWLLIEVHDHVSAGPLPTTTTTNDHRPGQAAKLYYMFGFWGMDKNMYFVIVTAFIALFTFLAVLWFAIWTFITEAREFDQIRRKRLARQREREAMEMQTPAAPPTTPPSRPASSQSESEPELDPPSDGQLQICRSASFNNLHLSNTTMSTVPLPRSKSMGAFNNEMGDNIQIHDLAMPPK